MTIDTSGASAPSETYTLQQFINMYDADKITYRKTAILQRSLTEPDLVYAIDNVIYTYLDDMKKEMKIVKCTTDEKIKYAYKPKLLAYNIYGTTESFYVLMALNGVFNIKDFDLEKGWFYALKPAVLGTYISRILLAESEHLLINRNNLDIVES